MVVGNLPELCLQNVFKHLKHDCITLYSCIRINKRWCYSSIPVLWANPFGLICFSKSIKHLLDTYLSFLSQNQLQALEIKPKLDRNSLTFYYPIYFRHMDLLWIYNVIKDWCKMEFGFEESRKKEVQICKAL